LARNSLLLAFAVLAGSLALAAAGGGLLIVGGMWLRDADAPSSPPRAAPTDPGTPRFDPNARPIFPPRIEPGADWPVARTGDHEKRSPAGAASSDRPSAVGADGSHPIAAPARSRIRRPGAGKNSRPAPTAAAAAGTPATAP
jgi:hypothetical protein